MYELWRWSNLGLAFLLELAGLAIFAWWGWHTGGSTAISLLLAIGLPVLAATIWGLVAAPTANYGTPALAAAVKLAFLALATLALWSLDHRLLAATFVLVVAANVLTIRTGNLAPTTSAATSNVSTTSTATSNVSR